MLFTVKIQSGSIVWSMYVILYLIATWVVVGSIFIFTIPLLPGAAVNSDACVFSHSILFNEISWVVVAISCPSISIFQSATSTDTSLSTADS